MNAYAFPWLRVAATVAAVAILAATVAGTAQSRPAPPGPIEDAIGVDTASTWYLRNVDGSDPAFVSTPELNRTLDDLIHVPDTGEYKREIAVENAVAP
jgi:hypothetical protein